MTSVTNKSEGHVSGASPEFAEIEATSEDDAQSSEHDPSGLTVDLLDGNSEHLWSRYVERHPDATVYHGLAWREAVRRAFRKPCIYLVCRRESGVVVGVLRGLGSICLIRH